MVVRSPSPASRLAYRGFDLASMKQGAVWRGRSFLAKKVADDVTADSELETIRLLRQAVDAKLGPPDASGDNRALPADALRAAFCRVDPSPMVRAMLVAHLAAPDFVLSATELAAAGGHQNFQVANSRYGVFAHSLAETLGHELKEKRRDGSIIWTLFLAKGIFARAEPDQYDDPASRWQLWPDIIAAFKGWDELAGPVPPILRHGLL